MVCFVLSNTFSPTSNRTSASGNAFTPIGNWQSEIGNVLNWQSEIGNVLPFAVRGTFRRNVSRGAVNVRDPLFAGTRVRIVTAGGGPVFLARNRIQRQLSHVFTGHKIIKRLR